MSNQRDFLVGLDVGTHKVLCVVARPGDSPDTFRVEGYGVVASEGVHKGVVADLEAVVHNVRSAVSEAQQTSGIVFERVWAAIGGQSLTSENCTGTAVVRGNEITQADVETAQAHAQENSLRQGKKLIKLSLQGYRYGDMSTTTILAPTGLGGSRVEALYHAVYGSVSNAENMKRCLQRAGLDLAGYEPHPWAAAKAVTTPSDRYNGVAVIDIGAETTSISVFHEHVLFFTDVRPFGAEYFTRDVSCVFNIDLDQAENLKTTVGHCRPDFVLKGETVQPMGFAHSTRTYSRHLLARTLEARAEEFCDIYHKLLERAGLLEKLGCIILTGGGANLKGLDSVVHRKFGIPVRVSGPLFTQGGSSLVKQPEASVALGIIGAAAASGKPGENRDYRTRSFSNLCGRLKTIFIGDY